VISFLADEDFDGHVISGIRHRYPEIQIQSIQELGMSGTSDPEILEWATQRDLVVLSRDLNTMTAYAEDRIREMMPFSGLLLVHDWMSRGTIIDQIEIWSRKDLESAFANPIQYLRPH